MSRGLSYEPFDAELVESVASAELLKDNKSRITWSNSDGAQSEWSIVYLPGLAPEPEKADPILSRLADKFSINYFEAPLYSSTVNADNLSDEISPKAIVDRGKEVISIGQAIGKKLILICNSVSAAPCIYLAGQNKESVDALILYAPVMETNSFFNEDLLNRWSNLRSAFSSTAKGRNIHREEIQAYTYLIRETMTDENLKLIDQPYFILYYFKDDKNKDNNVSLEAINRLDSLSHPDSRKKRTIILDRLGKGSLNKYYGDWQKVYLETEYYLEEVLKIKP